VEDHSHDQRLQPQQDPFLVPRQAEAASFRGV
jgi:hypothetical protein